MWRVRADDASLRRPIAMHTVDVVHEGHLLARQVRRILVVRLPAGSTQVFVLKRSNGSIHRATVRIAAGRTVSITVPPR